MRQSWKAADRRMNTVNELFQNVRFLKFYGWGEHPFPFPPLPARGLFSRAVAPKCSRRSTARGQR